MLSSSSPRSPFGCSGSVVDPEAVSWGDERRFAREGVLRYHNCLAAPGVTDTCKALGNAE